MVLIIIKRAGPMAPHHRKLLFAFLHQTKSSHFQLRPRTYRNRGLLLSPAEPERHGAAEGRAQGGRRPRGAARARGGAQQRRAGRNSGVVVVVVVPGADQARDRRAPVRRADIPVRRVQPRVLRRGLRLPRPPRPVPPRRGGARRGRRGRGGGGLRRRLVQRAPPAHHQRHGRRQVRGRHTPQQRLLRARGRRGRGGDERPGAGPPLRPALPPQRHARHLRPLLRRARGRRRPGRAAAVAPAPSAAGGVPRPGRRRHGGSGQQQGLHRAAAKGDRPMTTTYAGLNYVPGGGPGSRGCYDDCNLPVIRRSRSC